MHTALGTITTEGHVNAKSCEILGLPNTSIFNPATGTIKADHLCLPQAHAERPLTAHLNAGAGNIGQYTATVVFTNGGTEAIKP